MLVGIAIYVITLDFAPFRGQSAAAAPQEVPTNEQSHRNEERESIWGEACRQAPSRTGDLKSLPMPEVEKKLASSPDGLSQAEAQKRLTQYGPNELKEEKTNLLLKFLSYFWGPIPWMIEVAVILSGVVRHWPDFFIILVLLFTNALVGFWEERQAGNAIAALKAKLAIKCRVRRDGKWVNPPARELVPGDVVRLRMGDIVPADARLLDGDELSVDQSALTGESLPVTRKPGDAVFSGSIVRRGEIGALVYATGEHTYFGKTAQLVQEAHTVSHFQKAVLKIGNYLIVLAVVLVAVIIVVALFRGDPMLHATPPNDPILLFALILTIAAIPVAMPTVLSVTMAVGASPAGEKRGDCEPVGGHRGTGRRRRSVRGQDRHADPEQAHARRSLLGQWRPCRSGHSRGRAGFARRITIPLIWPSSAA